jgi:hypothetical protein
LSSLSRRASIPSISMKPRAATRRREPPTAVPPAL